MSPLLWLLGLFVVGVAASGGGKQPQRTPTPKPSKPEPPPQGGAGPHPDAPNDPDKGRYYACLGATLNGGYETQHVLDVLTVANSANGTVVVDMWTNLRVQQQVRLDRCTPQRFVLSFADGRLMSAVPGFPPPACPAGSKPWTSGIPLVQQWSWSQTEQLVQLVFTAKGKKLSDEDDAPWYSPENAYGVGWCVDVLWEFKA